MLVAICAAVTLALPTVLPAQPLDYYPDWSPDGEWIVFSSDRAGRLDLYKIRPDGRDLTQLTDSLHHDTYPVWSPDGRTILFSRANATLSRRTVDLYLVDADGSNERRLTEGSGNKFMASWCSADRIVFSGDRDGGEPDVFTMRLDGSELTNLTPTPERNEGNPSCHGSLVLYDTPIDEAFRIQRLDLDGSRPPMDLVTFGTPWDANWSRDGQRIVLGVYGAGEEKLSRVAITDGHGGDLRWVTADGTNAFWPSWSPDASKLVMSYGDKPFSAGRLYIVRTDGSGLRPVEAKVEAE